MKKILLTFFILIGINGNTKDVAKDNSIYLIEDNYLMVELISRKNLSYAEQELRRVSKFGKEHFDGMSFTDATEIEQKPIATIDIKIPKKEAINLLESVGLIRHPRLMYFGINGPTEVVNPKTIVYGSLKSGIFLEIENNFVKNVWFDSQNWQEIRKTKLVDGFRVLGEKYDLILVDWVAEKIVNLKNSSEIEKYLSPNS